ncbi:hypothetical protein [Blastococcus sp. CT_GayMR16]|nr:hypothetical protein [Blastococcus sp. CT_GayMR16]
MKRALIATAVGLQLLVPSLAARLAGWLWVRSVDRALAYQRGKR